MLSARNLLYGFAASLVLFTIVMAIEQLYVREVDAVIAASHSPRDAKPGMLRVRGASVPTEGPADIEAAPEDGPPDRGTSPGMSQRSGRSEEHTSELQSRFDLVCRLLLEKKKEHNRSNSTRRTPSSGPPETHKT